MTGLEQEVDAIRIVTGVGMILGTVTLACVVGYTRSLWRELRERIQRAEGRTQYAIASIVGRLEDLEDAAPLPQDTDVPH
jgi:hypothetical protein